jgi:hypothetical protein
MIMKLLDVLFKRRRPKGGKYKGFFNGADERPVRLA